MRKEEFIELGIDEKLSEKAAAASKKELDGSYVPKDRFNEVNESKKQLEGTVDEYKTQLETLKTSAGDNEALKQEIVTLQEQNKQKDADYQADLKELKLTNAIRMGVTNAQDGDIVAGLIDREKVILGDDGKVTGLDEQLKTIKESKPFLFKEEQTDNKGGFQKVGAQKQKDKPDGDAPTLKGAIASHFQKQE